ncbi:MAG: response regulator [Anaerolineaceae bacterium]|jgi:DNA-binding response OmpR family regulator|nr:response regulator [Anaerolineaceae bacterium]
MQILIIDDDPASTDLFTLMLQQSIVAEVITANSSSEGIALSRKYQPDLIILNLMMPVMNGIEVCREIRQFYHRPILALSAIHQPEWIASALDAGADDCLCKPVGRSMLTTRIAGLLRRSSKCSEPHDFTSAPTFTTSNL